MAYAEAPKKYLKAQKKYLESMIHPNVKFFLTKYGVDHWFLIRCGSLVFNKEFFFSGNWCSQQTSFHYFFKNTENNSKTYLYQKGTIYIIQDNLQFFLLEPVDS